LTVTHHHLATLYTHIFLLHSPLAHPILHSFPTRCSSDLHCQQPLLIIAQLEFQRLCAPPLGHFVPRFAQSVEQNDRAGARRGARSEEHTSELQSQSNLVCRLLLEKKNKILQRCSEL